DILRAAINLGMALLAPVTLDLGHGHSVDANCRQRLTDLVKLEGFDDGDDELHVQAFISRDSNGRSSLDLRSHKSDIFRRRWHEKLGSDRKTIAEATLRSITFLYRRADRSPSAAAPSPGRT